LEKWPKRENAEGDCLGFVLIVSLTEFLVSRKFIFLTQLSTGKKDASCDEKSARNCERCALASGAMNIF
jgi:hypothetical protein